MLNLACSGDPDWALESGKYYWMVGDSASGKTFIIMTILAEASINPEWDGFDLIFDNVEDGALMDIEQFFGKKLKDRIQSPKMEEGVPRNSRTVEEFYFNLDTRLKAAKKKNGRPFIWMLDSMDALSTKYEGEKFQEKKVAFEKGTEAKGDYGDGKAKINSTYIRRILQDLREANCTLLILSQTRDNIDADRFGPQTVHAGGHALKFYATLQLWSEVGTKIKKEVNGKERQIGMTSRIAIKKNRITGRESTVYVPIYFTHGIDDVGSCVDFLMEEKKFQKDGNRIVVEKWGFKGFREALIEKIQDESLEEDLKDLVFVAWRQIENEMKVSRKKKYQ